MPYHIKSLEFICRLLIKRETYRKTFPRNVKITVNWACLSEFNWLRCWLCVIMWTSWRQLALREFEFYKPVLAHPRQQHIFASFIAGIIVSVILKKLFARRKFFILSLALSSLFSLTVSLVLKWCSTFEETGQHYSITDHLLANRWKIIWWRLS